MNVELVGTNDGFEAMQASEFIVVDHWRVKIEDVSHHFHSQGSWARDVFLGLDVANQTLILKEIAHFGLKLVQRISTIQAEHDSNNEAALNLAPLVMPFQLVEMASSDFIDLVLNPYRNQLAKFWPDEKIDLIERHQQELFNAYKKEPGSKLFIDKHDHTMFFNTGWDDLKGCFEHLRMFYGGLTNAFTNTTSVELDFSILKWEKDDFLQSMMNLTLEGIFQAKQRRVVMGILVLTRFDDGDGAQQNEQLTFLQLTSRKLITFAAICHFLFIADFEDF